MSLLVFSGKLL